MLNNGEHRMQVTWSSVTSSNPCNGGYNHRMPNPRCGCAYQKGNCDPEKKGEELGRRLAPQSRQHFRQCIDLTLLHPLDLLIFVFPNWYAAQISGAC